MEDTIDIRELPPMPQVVSKILQLDENNVELSSDQLQALISVDPALTAKIMKMANSAFFARLHRVSTLSQAITLLGFKTIKSLTLLVSASEIFNAKKSKKRVRKELWMHSVLTALTARILAEKAKKNEIKEEVFMAALMKNVGRLILLLREPDAYASIFHKAKHGFDEVGLHQLEKEAFSFTSDEIGKLAMQKWNFPQEIIDTVGLSFLEPVENPDQVSHFGLLVILAERYVYLKNLSGTYELPRGDKEKLLTMFVHDSRFLGFSHQTFDFILNELFNQIKEDDFYHFSSEIFSM